MAGFMVTTLCYSCAHGNAESAVLCKANKIPYWVYVESVLVCDEFPVLLAVLADTGIYYAALFYLCWLGLRIHFVTRPAVSSSPLATGHWQSRPKMSELSVPGYEH